MKTNSTRKSKMSAETLKEAQAYGHVYDDGKIQLQNGNIVTLTEARRRNRWWNKVVSGKAIA